MDRIIYNQQGSYLYPLLTPTGTYRPASQYPNIPTLSHQPATAAEKARQNATTATYNAYAAQAAAARAQAAAIQASRKEAATAAARLTMLQSKVTPASKGNPWSFVGAYRMGGATPTPVAAPVYRPAPIPCPMYRLAPPPAPAPAPRGSNWSYNPAGYYFRRQSAAAATYNAYAAQAAAAARAQVAAIQAARDEAAAAARLAMLQPKVTQASKGNPWSFVGGAYRLGEAATAPVQTPASVYRPAPVMTTPVYKQVPAPAPVYRPVSVPVSVYRPAPPSAPAPAPMGSNWTYNPNGYYFHR
ncbi:hypothetical protein BZA77DRAFT_368494 [Pyronema omphalodes]|nr:hypothetical protein BZA77DRAFT_368494 [Pyronema omphalodes]